MNNERHERIRAYLDELSGSDQVWLWNEYCDAICDYDSRLESMDSFNDLCYGKTPLEIVDMVGYQFNPNDDWFYFDGYGRCRSCSYPEDHINLDDIAEYIDSHDDPLYDDDLDLILSGEYTGGEPEDPDYVTSEYDLNDDEDDETDLPC